MNNNRGNNNRRRGRGNTRQQGGQQTNRIDSRARGNAPQLLEKYKKLAHDAHLNGDRVQEEYYLQFADHYFRVIADQRQRQDELRQPRRDDRPSEYGDDFGGGDEYEYETSVERAQERAQERPPRQDRHERQERYERPARAEHRPDARQPDVRSEPPVEQAVEEAEAPQGAAVEGERSVYEPVENPFVRDIRSTRGAVKPRKPRRPRNEGEEAADTAPDAGDAGGNVAEPADFSGNLDPASLPPAIAARPARKAQVAEAGEAEGEEKPRRRRTRKTPPAEDSGDSTLEAVNS